MKISNIKHDIDSGKAIVSADFVYGNGRSFHMYFSVDERYKSFLSADGSVFLPIGLMLAMKLGEDLTIVGSVSKRLYENVHKIIDLVAGWNVGFKRIQVTPTQVIEENQQAEHTGTFFSAGVDSFYTYFVNKGSANKVDSLISVKGFDIPLTNDELYGQARNSVAKVADNEGLAFIEVSTNVREVIDDLINWDFSHGAAMASVALAFRKGFEKVYFSGAMSPDALRPSGLHPDLDPLWSTENMEIVHEGWLVNRVDKIEYISQFPIVLQTLRVCWKNPKGIYNCCECEKCFRTMLGLYATGVLDECKTFTKEINVAKLGKLYVIPPHRRYFRQSLEKIKARASSDPRIIAAIEKCLERNEKMGFIKKSIMHLRKYIADLDLRLFNGKIYKFLSKNGWI